MRKFEAAITAIVLAAGAALHVAELPMPNVVPLESAPTTTGTAAGTAADTNAASQGSPTTPATSAGCCAGGCGGHCPWEPMPGHCPCLRRLIAWATYCPKERVCSLGGCNSCHYKGVLPLHPFVGRYCVNGSGVQPTFPNPTCGHGCKGCASGAGP